MNSFYGGRPGLEGPQGRGITHVESEYVDGQREIKVRYSDNTQETVGAIAGDAIKIYREFNTSSDFINQRPEDIGMIDEYKGWSVAAPNINDANLKDIWSYDYYNECWISLGSISKAIIDKYILAYDQKLFGTDQEGNEVGILTLGQGYTGNRICLGAKNNDFYITDIYGKRVDIFCKEGISIQNKLQVSGTSTFNGAISAGNITINGQVNGSGKIADLLIDSSKRIATTATSPSNSWNITAAGSCSIEAWNGMIIGAGFRTLGNIYLNSKSWDGQKFASPIGHVIYTEYADGGSRTLLSSAINNTKTQTTLGFATGGTDASHSALIQIGNAYNSNNELQLNSSNVYIPNSTLRLGKNRTNNELMISYWDVNENGWRHAVHAFKGSDNKYALQYGVTSSNDSTIQIGHASYTKHISLNSKNGLYVNTGDVRLRTGGIYIEGNLMLNGSYNGTVKPSTSVQILPGPTFSDSTIGQMWLLSINNGGGAGLWLVCSSNGMIDPRPLGSHFNSTSVTVETRGGFVLYYKTGNTGGGDVVYRWTRIV